MKKFSLLVSLGTFAAIGCSMSPNKNSSKQFSADKSISSSQGEIQDMEIVSRYTAGWPEASVKAATKTISRFGEPQESTSNLLLWRNVAPFKRITVYRDEVEHKFPMLHKDVIEHVVDYKVPVDKLDELSRFYGSLIYNRTAGELAARSDDEAMNFLALNLAHDIVTGQRMVDDARAEFGKVAMDYMNGNKGAYIESLQFARQLNTADADRPIKLNWATVPKQAEEARPTDEMKEYERPVNRQEMEAQESKPEEEELLKKTQKEELAE